MKISIDKNVNLHVAGHVKNCLGNVHLNLPFMVALCPLSIAREALKGIILCRECFHFEFLKLNHLIKDGSKRYEVLAQNI